MFEFRLLTLLNGNQIVDNTLKTPYSSLSPEQMMEYIEVDNSICAMKIIEKKRKADKKRRHTFTYRIKMKFTEVLLGERQVIA